RPYRRDVLANAVLPSHVPSPLLAILRRSPLHLERQNGLVLLSGHPAVFRLGLCVATDRALAGDPVLYLDGANVFDPFLIGRLARAGGAAPNAVLGRIHVSRAFTCHQMARLVTERLACALRTYHARLIILSGLLRHFMMKQCPIRRSQVCCTGPWPHSGTWPTSVTACCASVRYRLPRPRAETLS